MCEKVSEKVCAWGGRCEGETRGVNVEVDVTFLSL